MKKNKLTRKILFLCLIGIMAACKIPSSVQKTVNKSVPDEYYNSMDTMNMAANSWRIFFEDENLIALIDTALKYNQELNIIIQEINISNNEVQARKGEYLPQVNLGVDAGVEKVGRYTSQGANDANTEIEPGKEMPDPLPDFTVGAFASWEVDIWRKLRNSRDAAIQRYLGSIEGKNFMVTNLVAEIAISYYELLALDSKLALLDEYIKIQTNALNTAKLQKIAGEVTQLAVNKFEAEVLSTKSLRYEVIQEIIMTENNINFLLGRYPQPIPRNSSSFDKSLPDTLNVGIPSQLMENRPDILAAEYEMEASNLDVKVAKARFYPSFDIAAGVGFQAFNPAYFVQSPESILYGLAGDLVAPLINRKAIKADYLSANSMQVQAIYEYERTILNAFIEVANEVSRIDNLQKSYDLKAQEVKVLNQSIIIANGLFTSAKADYMEVLLTQRDALDARIELIEYKGKQFRALINLYRALGGGWK